MEMNARVFIVVRAAGLDALEQGRLGRVHGRGVREAEDGDELVPEDGELGG